MMSIKIEPAGPRDLAMHQEQYDHLVAALHEAGYAAEVELWERRSAELISPDVIIHVGEAVEGINVILGLVRRILRGLRRPPSREKRRVIIYGPNGETLAEVELDDDE